MKRIALVPGHGPSIDRGAVNSDGTTELDWNRDLANRIVNAIAGRVPVVVIHRQTEKLSPIPQINASGASLAVELHLNAFNGQATGTEMIHWPTSGKGIRLAQALQTAAVGVLKLKDRGIKPPQLGRGAAFLRKTTMPAVIVESFFIDNDNDLAVGNAKKDELARAYADVLVTLA